MSTYNLSWSPVAYISLFFMLLAQTVVAVETEYWALVCIS